MMIVIKMIFMMMSLSFGSFEYAYKQASEIDFKSTKSYSAEQINNFQEQVVDEMYKKLLHKDYDLKTNSKEFKHYVRAVGFLSYHSKKDPFAGSYVSELIEKLKIKSADFWKITSKILPKEVSAKLKSDYQDDIADPQA